MTGAAFAYISAGITMGLAALGTALGIGFAAARAVEGTARQPEASGLIRTTMLIAAAMIEAIALYAFVVAFLLQAKK
ncbi:MAG: ATP synthase F0 subunit C [Chloroflexi bacterium]|nr:ATP synthase F0 subunit C [Chloroflexota bacterium]